jgi:hypothetical protein
MNDDPEYELALLMDIIKREDILDDDADMPT